MSGSKASSSATINRPKAQTSWPVKAKISQLSAELVGDSDDSDEEKEEEKEESIKATKNDAKITRPKSIDAKTTAVRPNSLKPAQSKGRKSPSPAPARNVANGTGTVKDSQDYKTAEDDSDDSSSSRASTPSPLKATTSSPVRGAKPKPLKPQVSNGPTSSKTLKPPDAHLEKRKAIDSTGEEDSESTGTGSSEDESEDESASSDKTSPQSLRKSNPAHQSAHHPPLPRYQPPPGFEPASISSHPSSQLSELLAPSNLAGKQIWHVTVPASVPVGTIQELSAQSIQTGEAILCYKGADYGLVQELGAEASHRTLLLPSSGTNDYQPSNMPILKTLHLQQLVKLPNHAYHPAGLPNLTSKPQTHVKVVRQQPQGLKMRYHAFGASDSSESDEPATTAIKSPQFRVPDVSSQKRKRTDSVSKSDEVTITKSKKCKAWDDGPIEAEESAMDVDSDLNEKLMESSRSSIASPVDVRPTAVNGVKSTTEKKRTNDDQSTPTASQSILPTGLRKEAENIVPQEVVNINAGINKFSPEKDAKAAKAQRKEERRKHKEMEKATPTKAAEESLAKLNESIPQESKSQSREQPVPLPTSRHSSQQNTAAKVQYSRSMSQTSNQSTPYKETKEERAKRKAEKRKRKVDSNLY